MILSAPYFVDATELGDLLPLTGTEFVTGTESRRRNRRTARPRKGRPQQLPGLYDVLCHGLREGRKSHNRQTPGV